MNMNAYENKANEEQAYMALRAAQVWADKTDKPMKSSAVYCAEEALRFFNEGRFGFAHEWALSSLSYSVGIFHRDYTASLADRKGA